MHIQIYCQQLTSIQSAIAFKDALFLQTFTKMNCQAYKLDIERHTFRGDELVIRPIADPAANGLAPFQPPPPTSAPILSGTLHSGHLELRRGPTAESPLLVTAQYPTSSAKITFKTGHGRVKLAHSYVQVDAWGRTSENAKPKKGFWSGRVKDGSRGCYVGFLPDGTKLRWEAAGPRGDVDAYRKAKRRHRDDAAVKLRCVVADPLGATVAVLGEMLASNDVVRLMPGAELLGRTGSMMGVYVLLGFVSLFERARARDKKKAETEFQVDFMIDGGGDGGGGDGGGGDGGGGGGGS